VHDWKVTDYSDCDPGLLHIQCKTCGGNGYGVLTPADFETYAVVYDGLVLLSPEHAAEAEAIVTEDCDAMGLNLDGSDKA